MIVEKIMKVDGTLIPYPPVDEEGYRLKEMQDIVGGYIEIVDIPHTNTIAVVNEEGMYTEPLNPRASEYISRYYGRPVMIYGPVLFCKDEQVK